VGNIETPKQPHKYTLAQIEILCNEFHQPIERIFYSDDEKVNEITIKDIIHKIIEYQK
jgi:putative transcriptional regulator